MVDTCIEKDNHSLYKHDAKKGMVIFPRHYYQELKTGTEQSILKLF